MDNPIPARKPDLVLINKKNVSYCKFCCASRSQVKVKVKGCEKQGEYLPLVFWVFFFLGPNCYLIE